MISTRVKCKFYQTFNRWKKKKIVEGEKVFFIQLKSETQKTKMPRKLMKFLILFDNTNLLFFPGQFLSGRVLLELQEDTPALGKYL